MVVVHSISWRNSGLAADDGSGILQIGTKFLPTLLATIYVFLASVLLDDVKPFILGFLIISPLSSSLIVSQTVALAQQTRFLQLDIRPSMPIQAQPLSETYYRSISSVLRNVTTSAWISDQYAVVPFWPASFQTIPLGPILFDTDQTWTATTSVFSTELICEPLTLTNVSGTDVSWSSEGNFGFVAGRNTTVSSQGDCTLFFLNPYDIDGSIIWAALNETIDDEKSFTSSGSCSEDEYYLSVLTLPETIIIGEACKAVCFQGETTVTASLINGESIVKVDEQQYHANRKLVSPELANISTFQNAFLSTDWNIHLSATDITKYSHQPKRLFIGPGNLLGALYNFSPERMTTDLTDQRKNTIQRIKGRFFGELLRDCFNNNRLHDPAEIHGIINTSPRRLVVVSAVAITLEVVFLLVLAILSVTFYQRDQPEDL
ncbi:hypothetical protein GQX73_g10341 [Xylaria multiplex]|uniref:Uncharacterized protein n=1 Tax=Xylaria multiplex TaxID=323545 RepID=A0A7C8MFI2_9PEZI|nr:hypothetical protein GQX73_g10341 [Xylaria multiplex]